MSQRRLDRLYIYGSTAAMVNLVDPVSARLRELRKCIENKINKLGKSEAFSSKESVPFL